MIWDNIKNISGLKNVGIIGFPTIIGNPSRYESRDNSSEKTKEVATTRDPFLARKNLKDKAIIDDHDNHGEDDFSPVAVNKTT